MRSRKIDVAYPALIAAWPALHAGLGGSPIRSPPVSFQDTSCCMPAAFAALAIADGGANAVGAVRFACCEGHLEIELVRMAGYAEGFALGGVATPVRFSVPYTAVRGLFRRGKALCIALD